MGSMNSGEHFMATDIEWDPTGRYIMTAVSWWGHKVDNAYWVWSFQGKLLKRFQMDRFCQFSWRPRPPCYLTNKQIREIKKNLKKYSVEFDVIDKMKISEISKELLEKRQNARKKFDDYRRLRLEELASQKEARLALRNGVDTDNTMPMTKSSKRRLLNFWSVKKQPRLNNFLKFMFRISSWIEIYYLMIFLLIRNWCQENKDFQILF